MTRIRARVRGRGAETKTPQFCRNLQVGEFYPPVFKDGEPVGCLSDFSPASGIICSGSGIGAES